jgi:hypothetical protein
MVAPVPVKRSLIKYFIDTTPESTATYSLVGPGITSAQENMNPQTVDEHYIHEDVGRTELESYRPTIPVEGILHDGDDAYDFVYALYRAYATLDAAKTTMVVVYLNETPTGSEYPAKRHDVVIAVDAGPGGEAGKRATMNYTIYYQGDPTFGTFNPTTLAFTPDA